MKKIYSLWLFFLVYCSASAQIITIPDANFKAKLLQADVTNSIASSTYTYSTPIKIDTNNNGEIEVNEALIVRALDVSSSAISSLTGIASFSNLRKLTCKNNSLTTLDVNALILLRFLNCANNNLTSLQCATLNNTIELLNCSNNNLTSLQLPNFFEFISYYDDSRILDCSNNQLTSLSFNTANGNEEFSRINLQNNSFTSIAFPNVGIYGSLNLDNNPLTCVDFTNTFLISQQPGHSGTLSLDNTMLTEVVIPFDISYGSSINNNSLLTSINIKNNENNFFCYEETDQNGEETGNIICESPQISNNPLLSTICCDSNEVTFFSATYPTVQVVTNCNVSNPNCNLSINESENIQFSIHPNPTFDVVNLSFNDDLSITKTTISNVLGQTIMMFGNQKTIDLSTLTKGVYFVSITTNDGTATQRIIKK